jgi:glycosyltransferase involved in cell wall biosynthesis
MEKMKISGLVLTHNNSNTIERCIESIKDLIDELIIIDDYSEDNTLEIIKKVYPKVIVHKRKLNNNFGAQRNFAIEKATYDWIIFIDSDEEITPRLKEEIITVLKKPKYNAYISRRDNRYLNMWNQSNSGRPILFKKNLRFVGHVHEIIKDIKTGYLFSPLKHHSWIDVTDWANDLNVYSGWNANKWIEEKRNFSNLQLFLIGFCFPFYYFFKKFLSEKRWKGGWLSMIYCLGWCAEWPFSALKYYELKNKKK